MQSQRIVIGTDTTSNEVISYLPDGTGAFGNMNYIGIIGNGMLSKFNLIIDIVHSALYLKRFKEDQPPVPNYDFGFRNRTDIGRGWIVSSLTRDGDAARAGLQLNDRIIAINGRPVEDYTWEEEYRLNRLPQITLDVIGPDDESKQITLSPALRW
jgi:S1-C subfamily serine protease